MAERGSDVGGASTSGPALQVERRDDGVVLLTLNLPERRNAMTAELTDSWVAAIGALRGDREVRAVVVTGAGSAFCAGGDVGWIGSEPDATVDALRDRMLPFYRAWLSVTDLEVPTIAAVNGPAIGAGLCLAMACDLRYAAIDARLAAPFTALGMHPGMAATWLLPHIVGLPVARELLFSGRSLTGAEAAQVGLVNQAFPADSMLAQVLAIAADVADQAPIALRLTKAALARGGPASLSAALEWEALAQPVTLATEDLHEGLRARAERRPPRFLGR